ncbi:MAG: radical SAM protein [Nitrospirota bacterium]
MIKINEIYKSIQGESSFAGQPCVFIRTTFCNLRCRWCDTAYAFFEGEDQTQDAIISRVRSFETPLVEITGGEPLLQEGIYPLITRLLDEGFRVLIETSGSLPINRLDPRTLVIMDLKPPGSGMSHTIHWENLTHLKPEDEVKFVISDRNDFEWAKSVIGENPSLNARTILFSPVLDEMNPALLSEWILKENLPVRLSLQLHKLIWDKEMRGV